MRGCRRQVHDLPEQLCVVRADHADDRHGVDRPSGLKKAAHGRKDRAVLAVKVLRLERLKRYADGAVVDQHRADDAKLRIEQRLFAVHHTNLNPLVSMVPVGSAACTGAGSTISRFSSVQRC